MIKIVKLNATWCARFLDGPLIYWRKVNQHLDTMGWFDRKNTIYFVDQRSFFKNSIVVIHELLHYLIDRTTNGIWIILAWLYRLFRLR